MDQVAKHIKDLRKHAGLTQDDLAERMHVTRQTVSSWETGRTQPDIETLSALAEALGTDVNGLIYGPKPAAGVWRRYQRKYLAWTLAGAAVLLACFLADQWLIAREPWKRGGNGLLFHVALAPFLMAFTAGFAAPALVSLWADLRQKSRAARRRLLAACVLCLLPALLIALWLCGLFAGSGAELLRQTAFWLLVPPGRLLTRAFQFLAGMFLFLGSNP